MNNNPAEMPAPVLKVLDVYGRKHFVRYDDYTSPRIRIQVPKATREGIRWCYRLGKNGSYIHKPGEPDTIHRDNIAKIWEI